MNSFKRLVPGKALTALAMGGVIVCALSTAALGQGTPAAGSVQAADGPPPASALQAGDLLWPKVSGIWVPFSSRPGTEQEREAADWEREKAAFLKPLLDAKSSTDQERELYSKLANLDYPTFKVLYLDDADPARATNFGGNVFYVGHVGIVDLVDGVPWVYEAVMGIGVRRITYQAWLEGRKGELVWLGRLNDATPEQRAAVASKAAEYIDKPYKFFNFDLSDTSGFYCSKLAWFAITSATKVPPDDVENPHRTFWYSPKRLMRSRHITLVYNPGNYAIR